MRPLVCLFSGQRNVIHFSVFISWMIRKVHVSPDSALFLPPPLPQSVSLWERHPAKVGGYMRDRGALRSRGFCNRLGKVNAHVGIISGSK